MPTTCPQCNGTRSVRLTVKRSWLDILRKQPSYTIVRCDICNGSGTVRTAAEKEHELREAQERQKRHEQEQKQLGEEQERLRKERRRLQEERERATKKRHEEEFFSNPRRCPLCQNSVIDHGYKETDDWAFREPTKYEYWRCTICNFYVSRNLN
jgi:hypothetical protein